jgi:alpha-ketoglutarate-dependent sulfate ester dioxygenase
MVEELTVLPVSGLVGAEVRGVDLSRELDDATVAALWQALLANRVIFLRGQNLDADGQVAFASRFGALTAAHPTLDGLAEQPAILDLDYSAGPTRANNWHTDVTFVLRPPAASVLRAVTLPSVGGDTLWADTVGAYEDLPDELRAFADSLWALHTNDFDYTAALAAGAPDEVIKDAAVFSRTVYRTLHPVVRVHPETGARSLLLGRFAQAISGLSGDESREVIRLLQARVTRPERTIRWRWAPGDVAIWDNSATQHYATSDYGAAPRRMQRVTLAGQVPESIDGRSSQVISGGDAASYSSAPEPAHAPR